MAITEAQYRRYKINSLYHFARVENVPSIRERGLLSHNAVTRKKPAWVVKNISDSEVQNLREDRLISVCPLHDYVLLYFTPKNAMPRRRQSIQNEIVILCLDRDLLVQAETVFTNDNAAG